MLIGILSDTHDDMKAIQQAVDIFNAEGVSHVIHAGDLTSPFTFDLFDELRCSFTAIFGNNDGDRLMLKQRSKGTIYNQPYTMTFDGKKIIMVHEPDLINALADSGHYDIVVYGHTHEPEVRRQKDTLVLNPGKTARLHRGQSTLILLDTSRMDAEITAIES